MPKRNKVKIEGNGRFQKTRYYFEGIEVLGVQDVKVSVTGVPVVTITFNCELELDGEILLANPSAEPDTSK